MTLGTLLGKAINAGITVVEWALMQPSRIPLASSWSATLPRACGAADRLAEAEEEYETSPGADPPGDSREVQDTGEASAVGPTSRHPLHWVVENVLKNHRLVDIMEEDDERWQRWGCFHPGQTRPHQRFSFHAEWRAHVADEVVVWQYGKGSDDRP